MRIRPCVDLTHVQNAARTAANSGALAKRHALSRTLIRIWGAKDEAGKFDDDARAADLLQAYEATIAALERKVGRQALEIEF